MLEILIRSGCTYGQQKKCFKSTTFQQTLQHNFLPHTDWLMCWGGFAQHFLFFFRFLTSALWETFLMLTLSSSAWPCMTTKTLKTLQQTHMVKRKSNLPHSWHLTHRHKTHIQSVPQRSPDESCVGNLLLYSSWCPVEVLDCEVPYISSHAGVLG